MSWLAEQFCKPPLLRAGRRGSGDDSAVNEPEKQTHSPTVLPAAVAQPPAKTKLLEVTVIRPIKREIFEYLDVTGSTEASASIEIRPRIAAVLNKVLVQPETKVKRGDILFELDSLALQIKELKAADRVRQWEAGYSQANRFLDNLKLGQKQALGQASDENPVQRRQREEAAGENGEHELAKSRIGLKVAQVEWEQAKNELNAAKITAPIDGRVGRILLSEGSLVGPTSPLTTLVSSDPIKAVFQMDELSFRKVQKQLPGTGAGPKMTVLLGLAGENDFPRRGFVESVDNHFQPATGTIRTWAVFPNPREEILPGMWARIRLLTGKHPEMFLVPEQSIFTDQGRKFVWLVNDKNEIERRDVILGLSQDGLRSIEKGLDATDRVVTKSAKAIRGVEVVKPSEVPLHTPDTKSK